MADPNQDRFEERLKAIGSKQGPGKRVKNRVRRDGLVVQVTKRDPRGFIPYRSIILLVFLGLVTKGFLLARIGDAEYQARLQTLKNGSGVESAAAVLLTDDPVTRQISGLVKMVLPQ